MEKSNQTTAKRQLEVAATDSDVGASSGDISGDSGVKKKRDNPTAEDARFSNAQIGDIYGGIQADNNIYHVGSGATFHQNTNRDPTDEISKSEEIRLLSLCEKKLKRKYIKTYAKLKLPGSNYEFDLKKLYIRLHCDFEPGLTIGEDEDDDASDNQETFASASNLAPSNISESEPDLDRVTSTLAGASITESPVNSESEDESEAENTYDSESEDEPVQENSGKEIKTFHRFEVLIEEQFQANKKIIISGIGGIGKTTASKMYCLDWSNGNHLKNVSALIRIDLKHPISLPDLFIAFKEQHDDLFKENPKDLMMVVKVLRRSPGKVAWVLDGLDEASPNARELVLKLFDPEKQHCDSSLLLLTRSESLEELQLTSHYTLRPLKKEEYVEFIQKKYPFTNKGKTAQQKREELLEKCASSETGQTHLAIPFFLMFICFLFDSQEFGTDLQDSIDLLLKILGLSVKNTLLKLAETNTERIRIMRLSLSKILDAEKILINGLGYALFKTNGDRISGYSDILIEDLEMHISDYLKATNHPNSDKLVAIIKKLGLFEINVKFIRFETKTVARFYHRNTKDVVLSYFLTNRDTTIPLPITVVEEKMKDSETTIIRSTMAIFMKTDVTNEPQMKLRLLDLYDYVFHTYIKNIDQWRRMQILVDLICYFLQVENKRGVLGQVIAHVVQKVSSLDARVKHINSQYLQLLADHMKYSDSCGQCVIPKCFRGSSKKRVLQSNSSLSSQWPQKQCFSLPPLIHNSNDEIKVAFPSSLRPHLDLQAFSIFVKSPKLQDKNDDLPNVQSLPSPIGISSKTCLPVGAPFDTSKDWVVAHLHVAFLFQKLIWVWGGDGKNVKCLPGDLFWSLDPTTSAWSQVKTTGDIPKGRYSACGAIIGHEFYLSGGHDGSTYFDDLSVCNLKTSTWRQIKSKGKSPVGRTRATAWSHKGKFYLFGGYNNKGRPSDKFLRGGEWKDDRTNQLSVFSPKSNEWNDVEGAGGPKPAPRNDMGQARIRDAVYIVGGQTGHGSLSNAVWVFDHPTQTWSELQIEGPKPEPRRFHSISAVTRRHLVLVGGEGTGDTVLQDVWSFDVDTKTWRKEERLPEGSSLRYHTATTIGTKTVILGGWDKNLELSEKMFFFSISN